MAFDLSTREFEALGTDSLIESGAQHLGGRSVATCTLRDTVDAALANARGMDLETANVVVVLDGQQHVAGTVRITRLLGAAGDRPVRELMDPDPPMVVLGDDPAGTAERLEEKDAAAVVVVDDDGRLAGVVPPHRLIALLIDAHERELARLGGFLHRGRKARRAAEESVPARVWHRLPWLLAGMAGAMLTVTVVAGFEEQLANNVLIAFFLPAVVYLADAVGTQTEAVMIRAMAVGVRWPRVVRRELVSGLVIGLLAGLAFCGFAIAGWGEVDVGVAVGIALVISCATATTIAMALPMAIARAGLDPAFGSGPLATVIQDLISIAAYLVVAAAIVA